MTTIREILDSLSPEQKRLLAYAHEHDITQAVVLPDGKRYVGVNIDSNYGKPDMTAGKWSSGCLGSGNAATNTD